MAEHRQQEPAPRVVAADDENIGAAARLLVAGEIVAFPTETVYGLGGDATSDRAVARIFEAKERPRFNPLIVHFPNTDAARAQAAFDARAHRLVERFWPGALTLVLPRRPDCTISLLASAGLDSLAVRVPRHAVAHALLIACGRPIAAPSANASGKISATTAEHVARSLGAKVAMILDGGRCPIGIESTVLDLTGPMPVLLRPGGVTPEELTDAIGPLAVAAAADGAAPKSPGMLASHYAPELPLRLDARDVRPHEALLAFGACSIAGAAAVENLSPSGDLVEAAANLFAMLRALDRPELGGIAVMPIPDHGLGRAINDRLRRAAAR
jgi:L-threonylcarbamoyladenylate synthase